MIGWNGVQSIGVGIVRQQGFVAHLASILNKKNEKKGTNAMYAVMYVRGKYICM